MNKSENKSQKSGVQLFLILTGIFIASLVTCNLIFNKFFFYDSSEVFGFPLAVSVGILPYPITFLATDLISELYGKKRANQVVISGFIVSLFVLLTVLLADNVSATNWSKLSDEEFHQTFGNAPAAILASMLAYLLAQFLDVKLFHFLKRKTNGKMLWLRNNLSTIPSQLADTLVVLLVLCAAGVIPWLEFRTVFVASIIFKTLAALFDTPLIYVVLHYIRKHYRLMPGEELKLV